MAKPRKKATVKIETTEELEIDPSPRDFFMARLAAGRAAAQAAISALDELLNLCINPEDDKKGKEREELLGETLESLGCACRAVEMAEATFEQVDLDECEPWDEDGEEDEDEDEDDEEEDDEDGDD